MVIFQKEIFLKVVIKKKSGHYMDSRGHTRTKGGSQGHGMVLLSGLAKQGACRV